MLPVRFALVGSGFLVVPHVGGGAVMGGAAGAGLRMQSLSRAAHRALHTGVQRHRVRADRRSVSKGRIYSWLNTIAY